MVEPPEVDAFGGPPGRLGVAAVHPQLQRAFLAFDDAALSWCILRGEGELDRPTGDVDLLLAPEHGNRLREVLDQLGWAPLPAWGFGDHRFFLHHDRTTGHWLKLDVVTSLRFGHNFELTVDAPGTLLERRRRDGQVPILDDDDAFWALLCHRLLDKGHVGDRDRPQLRALARRAGTTGPIPRTLEELRIPGGSPADLIDAALSERWDELAGLAPILRRRWRRHAGLAGLVLAVGNLAARTGGRVNRYRRRPGLTVAVLAPDGAGKTTLLDGLQASIPLPVVVRHMGLYRSRRREARLPATRTLGVVLRLWVRWVRAARRAARGSIVLFDRYPYDAAVQAVGRTRRTRLRRLVLRRALPRPALVIVLDAPGEVLNARKPEKSIERLDLERAGYLALADRMPTAMVLDATQDPEVVVRQATALIWERLGARWRASFTG